VRDRSRTATYLGGVAHCGTAFYLHRNLAYLEEAAAGHHFLALAKEVLNGSTAQLEITQELNYYHRHQ